MANLGDLYSGAHVQASGSGIPAQITAVQLLPVNPNRKGVLIYNDSPSMLFLKFGPAVTSNSYTLQVAPMGLYQSQWPIAPTTVISGRWGAASGSAYITEIT